MTTRNRIVDAELLEDVTSSIREGRPVDRRLGTAGRLFIDRQLPYLCVYRHAGRRSDWGTDQLVGGEASYLTITGTAAEVAEADRLVQLIASELGSLFGAFLILEIWSGADVEATEEQPVARPCFQVHLQKGQSATPYLHTLAKHLSLVDICQQFSQVSMTTSRQVAPPGLKPLLSARQLKELNASIVGVEVAPIYRSARAKENFPAVLDDLQTRLITVFERTCFDFLKHQTTICPPNYLALGQRSLVQAVWEVDRMLSEVADNIDFLLLVTPTNTNFALAEFRKNLYQKEPVFLYHPAPFNPIELKRRLYRTPIEKLEDPTLAHMFREQLEDIDSRIAMISERGTRNFLYSSLKLYDRPDDRLVNLARKILRVCHDRGNEETSRKLLTPEEFAALGEQELAYYRKRCPDLGGKVYVRDDVPGVMVSQGNLLIGSDRRVSKRRAYALLSHEVGTHILTNYNGKAQRFRQMSAGLPGYDELQESLAVLGEYLVGGLTGSRLRTLAARVMAVHWLCHDAEFIEVYRKLTTDWDFSHTQAFLVTMRVFRSGGFTKDVVYLRGLTKLTEQIKQGLQLEMLFVGKYGIDYLPIVRELMYRDILLPARLKPRYFDDPEFNERVRKIKKGISILNMVADD